MGIGEGGREGGGERAEKKTESSPLSPFLTGRTFLREPSWKYSAKLVGS